MLMMRKLFSRQHEVESVLPRVTPDPRHAAGLARKFSELSYCPEVDFHRDRRQSRLDPIKRKRK
jgi:hypothetical protein